MQNYIRSVTLVLLLGIMSTSTTANVTGELKQWHKATLTFAGPQTDELATPNPFTDYRLNVTFSKGNETYIVPGFFAADGDAANMSASAGNKWRVHFTPSQVGEWSYKVSFRSGKGIAIGLDENAGSSAGYMDGVTGSLKIGPTDKTGRDHRATGRLQYVGEHYLQYAGSKEFFLKVGPDSPENAFAYEDFDATPNRIGLRKSWQPHQQDYVAEETAQYTWKDGKGTELLGALKYLASEGANSFSFMPFTFGGDDQNVFPHLLKVSVDEYESLPNYNSWDDPRRRDHWNTIIHKTRFDVSKLAQWEQVFSYADQLGVYIHFKLLERENDFFMDDLDHGKPMVMGPERKLFMRELIARFGHHLALNWNLGEEPKINTEMTKAFGQYIHDVDPYDHLIVIHNWPPGGVNNVLGKLYGDASALRGASSYISNDKHPGGFHGTVSRGVSESRAAGKKWVVACDEQDPAGEGVDADPRAQDMVRNKILWGTLMAGGAGAEYYYGYGTGETDLTAQNHRSRASKWRDAKIAMDFFRTYLPFHEMIEMDELTPSKDDYVFAKEGVVYCIYVPHGGETEIELPAGTWQVEWFDPRNGGGLKSTNVKTIAGPGKHALGNAPDSTTKDWVILVSRKGGEIGGTSVDVGPGVRAEDKDHILNPKPKKVFLEKDGLVVIEAEHAELPKNWIVKNTLAKHTGAGYIQWEGEESFYLHLSPTEATGVITYSFRITTPDVYRVMWRTRQYPDVERGDADNDMYFRFASGEDAEGMKDLSVFSKAGTQSQDEWTWRSWILPGEKDSIGKAVRKFDAGIHHFQIAGRAKRYPIDRFVISKVDVRDFSTYWPDVDESVDPDANFLMELPESEVEVLGQ